MQPLIQLLDTGVDIAALAILLIFVPLLIVFTLRARRGHTFALRRITAYERMQELVHQAAESGQPIHVGMGSGQVGAESTAEAAMSLTVFDYVASHAAAYNQAITGTMGDGTILAAAQGVLQQARREAGFPERYVGSELRFSGPEPLAYVAGAARAIKEKTHLASLLFGRFGVEGLWLGEALSDQGLPQLGGASDPSAQALMQPALDEAVIGEEIYAAGAYLHRPSHLGSLATQDVMRIVIILAIIVGVVMTSLGYWG